MDHGERAIVPVNCLLIAGTFLLWAVSLPLWSTFAIAAPIAVALLWIAFDKYGGMQLCLLAVMGWMTATIGVVQTLRSASATETAISTGYVVLTFLGAFVGGVAALLLGMALIVAGALAWEWTACKLGRQRGSSHDRTSA